MSLCILCPGQGSQSPAMLARLASDPLTGGILTTLAALVEAETIAVATDPLHCFLNRHAQPLIVLYGLTVAHALSQAGIDAELVAGYSVGELTAHGVAGALAPQAVLSLARARALAMDAVSPHAYGMLAVRGVPLEQMRNQAHAFGLAVAIVNGPDHVVLAGPGATLQELGNALTTTQAPHVVPLPISVPAHTAWLEDGVAGFTDELAVAAWQAHRMPVLSGIDGRPLYNAGDAIERLGRQIAEPLDWGRTMDVASEMGATVFFELGPGCGLTRMIRERFPDLPARSLGDFDTVRGAIDWLGRHFD